MRPCHRLQEDFDDFANPEDIYEALDLDNIPQLPTVIVPHAPGATGAPRDKEKEREKERERAAAAAIKGQLAAHGLARCDSGRHFLPRHGLLLRWSSSCHCPGSWRHTGLCTPSCSGLKGVW